MFKPGFNNNTNIFGYTYKWAHQTSKRPSYVHLAFSFSSLISIVINTCFENDYLWMMCDIICVIYVSTWKTVSVNAINWNLWRRKIVPIFFFTAAATAADGVVVIVAFVGCIIVFYVQQFTTSQLTTTTIEQFDNKWFWWAELNCCNPQWLYQSNFPKFKNKPEKRFMTQNNKHAQRAFSELNDVSVIRVLSIQTFPMKYWIWCGYLSKRII